MTEPLTTGQVAKYCHVTYRTVCLWIDEGKLKAYRTPGQHSRIQPEDFIDFLKRFKMPIPEALQSLSGSQTKKILIVDDDKNMANAIERLLTQEGSFMVEVAYDGFDAGRKMVSFSPRLVILDIKMPGLDGYEVTKRIKNIPQMADTKIMAVSAFFDNEGKERILGLGADVCLEKPFSNAKLLEEINRLFWGKNERPPSTKGDRK